MKLFLSFIGISFFTCNALFAASTKCKDIYFDDTPPLILYTKLKPKTKELCYHEFAVMYSGLTKTPLWSAEHLTKEKVPKKISRTTNYHAEDRLKENERADILDYIGSHYDRGVLASSGDFSDNDAYRESFSLANVVPQNHYNRVGIWAKIEEAVRAVAKKEENIYVITGTLYMDKRLQEIHGGIIVPTKLFKAVFVPATGQGAAYVVNNSSSKEYEVIGIAELEKISGINIFPSMLASAKMNVMKLPDPNNLNDNNSQWKPISKDLGIDSVKP